MENMPSGGVWRTVWRICLLGGVWRTVWRICLLGGDMENSMENSLLGGGGKGLNCKRNFLLEGK